VERKSFDLQVSRKKKKSKGHCLLCKNGQVHERRAASACIALQKANLGRRGKTRGGDGIGEAGIRWLCQNTAIQPIATGKGENRASKKSPRYGGAHNVLLSQGNMGREEGGGESISIAPFQTGTLTSTSEQVSPGEKSVQWEEKKERQGDKCGANEGGGSGAPAVESKSRERGADP